jgi:hypothetical protein
MPKKIIYQIDPKRRNPDGSFPDFVFKGYFDKYHHKKWMVILYQNKAGHAKEKGIPFGLRFRSFLNFCRKTNYHKLRGTGPDDMVMDRIDNLGPYVMSNIQMLSNKENLRKYHKHDKKRGKAKTILIFILLLLSCIPNSKAMNKDLSFSGFLISVDDRAVDIAEFKRKIPPQKYMQRYEEYYVFNISYTNNVMNIYFPHGKPTPHNPEIVNVDTKTAKVNPRTAHEYEPKQQFALIDFSKSRLWLNNAKKRGVMREFLMEKLETDNLFIKDIYDEEEFINTIKRVDDIRISAAPDMFSSTHILSSELANDINGYEAVAATLSFRYENHLIGNNLLEKIKSLFQNKDRFRGITVAGRDQDNIGMLFNVDTFSQKIDFKLEVDDNEMFIEEEVFSELIDRL